MSHAPISPQGNTSAPSNSGATNGVRIDHGRSFANGDKYTVTSAPHPAGFVTIASFPGPRWNNPREALVQALAVIDTPAPVASASAQTPLIKKPAQPAATNGTVPALPPTPVKAPVLRASGNGTAIHSEVPAAPAAKLGSPKEPAAPARTSAPRVHVPAPPPPPLPPPSPPTPMAPLRAVAPLAPVVPSPAAPPVPSLSAPTPPLPESTGKTTRLTLATTAPFGNAGATKPPMKLRIAARPSEPGASGNPPIVPINASQMPGATAEPPVSDAPLVPIPGVPSAGGANRRPNSASGRSRPTTAPFVPNLIDAVPNVAAPLAPFPAIKSTASLTTPPMMMRHGASAIKPSKTNIVGAPALLPKKSPTTAAASSGLSGARILGYAVLLGILVAIGHSIYRSYNLTHPVDGSTPANIDPPTPDDPLTPQATPIATVAAPSPTPAGADPATSQATTPTPAPIVRPAPSEAFVVAVNALKISGVMQGSPFRAIVNGRRVEEGDFVNDKLAIRLVGLDHDARTLIFEDSTKAQAKLKY
jgi:hypothetical protein